MKVWCLFEADGDGHTWQIYELLSIHATQTSAEAAKINAEKAAMEAGRVNPELYFAVEEKEVEQ